MGTEDALERYQRHLGSQPAVERPHYPFTVGEAAVEDYKRATDERLRALTVDVMSEVLRWIHRNRVFSTVVILPVLWFCALAAWLTDRPPVLAAAVTALAAFLFLCGWTSFGFSASAEHEAEMRRIVAEHTARGGDLTMTDGGQLTEVSSE